MVRKLSKYLFLIALIVIFASCAQAEPFSPQDYTNLLIRSRNLFSLCTLLISQPEMYLGDIFSRLYYGYYHLGRLIFSNKFGYEYDSHNHVWKKMEEPIKGFGYAMKELREKYDYRPLSQDEVIAQSREDLQLIYDNRDNFDEMLIELQTSLNTTNYYTEDEKFLFLAEIETIKTEHAKFIDALRGHVSG